MGIGFPGNTSGESGHRPLDPKPKPGPEPKPVPRPRPDPRTEPFWGGDLLPRGGGRPPSGDPRRPIPVPRPREEVPRPRGREPVRRHEDEYTRRVRPSTLQKMVKKFDGSGDPHDHVASFKQVVWAEQVSDPHTQIEGFGLTLEGKALSWFQNQEVESLTEFKGLEKDFIAAFSKMGIKHNAVAQIYAFKQKDHESVRDCANRLKQYITRCPIEEKPSQARLISIFLEGLQNKTLHAHLYAKKHTSFNECCLDAMDYDDNFDISSVSSHGNQKSDKGVSSKDSESMVPSVKDVNQNEIAEMVLKRLGQLCPPPYRPTYVPQMPQAPQGPYKCGACAGNHRTEQCPTLQPMGRDPPALWCDACKWNRTHVTKDCHYLARMQRNQAYANPQQYRPQGGRVEQSLVPTLEDKSRQDRC